MTVATTTKAAVERTPSARYGGFRVAHQLHHLKKPFYLAAQNTALSCCFCCRLPSSFRQTNDRICYRISAIDDWPARKRPCAQKGGIEEKHDMLLQKKMQKESTATEKEEEEEEVMVAQSGVCWR